MSQICWWWVDILSRALDPDERDAVRGDFAESGESAGQALRDLIGLVARRQAALWKDWRPWVAPVGLIAPVLFGGTGIARISLQLRIVWTHGIRYEVGLPLMDDIVRLVCFSILAMAWAWSGGLALGHLSRRTVWVQLGLLGLLLWFCVAILRGPLSDQVHGMLVGLLPMTVLVLIPFLWGVQRGACGAAFAADTVMWLAVGIAILTLIAQVEGSREDLAFAAWSSGRTVEGRLSWTPRLLPFAAIAWQFGFVFATTRFKENGR